MIAHRPRPAGGSEPLPLRGERAYRTLVEQLPLVIYVDALDDVSSNLYTSPQVEALLGYTAEEWVANRELFVELLHPDDRDRVLNEVHVANESDADFVSEYRLVARDGRTVWLRDTCVTVRDEDGTPLYSQGCLLDITDRKAAEEGLRESEARFAAFMENGPLIAFMKDDEGRTSYVNEGFERAFAVRAEEIVGKRDEEWMLAAAAEEFRITDELVRESGAPAHRVERDVRPDGTARYWHTVKFPFEDARGRRHVGGVALDVTERHRAEEELRRREAVLGAIATVAEELLRAADWRDTADGALRALGQATGADRLLLFSNRIAQRGELRISVRHEWVAAGGAPLVDDPELQDTSLPAYGLASWLPELAAGRAIQGPVAELPDPVRQVLARRGVGAILAVPVFVGGAWWGFLLVEGGSETGAWTGAEVDALRTAAGIVGAAIQRRASEERSRATAAQLQAVVQASPAAIVGFDAEGRVTLWNPAAERTFGWAAGEVLGGFNPIVSEDQREEFRGYVKIALGGEGWRDLEIVRRRKDGSLIDVSASSAPLRDAAGQVVGLISVLIDITGRKRAEAEAREREERYRTLIENIPGAVYRCAADETWTMQFLSDDIEEITGYPAAEFLGNAVRSYASVIHPDDREAVERAVADAIAADRHFVIDYRIVTARGDTRWVYEQGQPVRGGKGELLWLDGVIIDITERKVVETELGQTSMLLDSVVSSIPVGLYVKDARDLTYVRVNPAAEAILGHPERELVGRRSIDVFPPELAVPFEEWDRQVLAGNARVDAPEAPLALGEGEPKIVHTTKVPILDGTGRPAYLLGIAEDITERRQAEAQREALVARLAEQNEQLLELDRLKDEFVALVSHELRTPLTSILGYLELAREEGELSDDVHRFLDVAERNSHRLLRLVSDLLFIAQVESGKLNLDLCPVDLSRLVRECVETALPRAAEKKIELTVEADDPCPLRGDPTRLGQVLDNLVSNALKFTPDGGTIRVRVVPDGAGAVIEVEDSGLGIPAAELDRLFERFFRTSTVTHLAIQGTGLGLPITKAIVEAHGGTIEVESEEGVGTTFRAKLPAGEAAVAEAAA